MMSRLFQFAKHVPSESQSLMQGTLSKRVNADTLQLPLNSCKQPAKEHVEYHTHLYHQLLQIPQSA